MNDTHLFRCLLNKEFRILYSLLRCRPSWSWRLPKIVGTAGAGVQWVQVEVLCFLPSSGRLFVVSEVVLEAAGQQGPCWEVAVAELLWVHAALAVT